MMDGYKAREILKLKEMNIQKLLILDLHRTIQEWLENPDDYKDLISKSLKDLRRQKVKFMNTFYKYFMSSDWCWLLHKKVVSEENNIKKQFKPVYQESERMSRMMTSDDGFSDGGHSHFK